MLVLQFLNDLLLLRPPLAVLQVVHVQLVLQVVNVRVLLNVRAVEALKLGLKALVLLLELRLNVLDSLQALVGTFQLDAPPLDRILKDGLVATERLHRLLHLFHLARLSIDDVANALLDILLLRVLVEVATDRVEEFESLVSSSSHFPLSSQHIVQFGTALSDLGGELARSLEVM